MRIVIYFVMGGEISDSSGWAKYVRELTAYLVAHGCCVKILCRMGHIYTDQNVKVSSKVESNRSYSSNFYFKMQHLPNPLTMLFGVVKLLKEFKKDGDSKKILHVHDVSCSILIGFAVAKIFKSPLVIQIHGFPLREQYIKLKSSPSLASNFIMLLTKIWHTLVIKIIKNSSNLVLVNNYEVKSFYEACGVSNKKIKVIPSAIDICKHEKNILSDDDARAYLWIKGYKKDLVIGYIGGLRSEKNLEMLIKAFAECVKSFPAFKAKLIIIGDGYMRPFLENAVKEHGIDKNTFFLGLIPNAYRFLSAIDIFVLPSLSEGSPLSLIEAMVAGRAIIASGIPGILEIVSHKKEAILINPHNVEELKQAILLLYNNPSLRAELGSRAKEKAKLYDVDKVYGQILKIYEELVRRKEK